MALSLDADDSCRNQYVSTFSPPLSKLLHMHSSSGTTFVKLAVVMFIELFTIPSIKARVRSIEREEGGGIGKGRIRES